MSAHPPKLAERLLRRALRHDPAQPAILGDLHEEYVEQLERSGRTRANLWYWREATMLAVTGSRSGDTGPEGTPWREDARYAWYAVRREPGFALFAMVVIGLGVGASAAVFSVMNPLMLAPLPMDDPHELVWIKNDGTNGSLSSVTSRTANLRDFRESTRTMTGMTGYNAFFDQSSYTLAEDGPAERLIGAGVAQDFLDVLGVQPLYGRNFSEEEGAWNGPPAIILTHGFWIRRFGADPSIVGRTVTLDGQATPVIGVLPESFDFASIFTPTKRVDFLLPFAIADETDRWGNTLSMVGRLAPGATVETAQADLLSIIDGLETADPERWGLGAIVTPLQDEIAGPFRGSMLLLAAAAGTLMLIVCVNLGNMILARAPRRRREMAVRRTMGATKGRLVRQLLFENLIRSIGGGLVGLGLAALITGYVSDTSGISIPLLRDVSIDGAALAVSALLAVAAGLVVGMIPALQVHEGGEAGALRSGSVRAGTGRAGARVRDMLIVAEVALACGLLLFGGLFLESFQRVLAVDLGFTPENRVAWRVTPTQDFETLEELSAFYDQVTAAVAETPGVDAVGVVDALPLGTNRTWGAGLIGEEERDDEQPNFSIFPHMVDEGYQEAMGIRLLQGRWFESTDAADTEWVTVINATGAERFFPGLDPIGRFIRAGEPNPLRVIGVVDDLRHVSPESDSGIQVYFPMTQRWAYYSADMVVRSDLPVSSIAGPVSAALSRIDPAMPVNEFWTIEETVERATSARGFTLALLAAFGSVAVLLAGLGIYGVLSHTVAERIPEIGIRMALGASGQDVRREVVGRMLVLAGIGMGVGVLAALVGARLIEPLLFGVAPTDPGTLATTVAILTLVSALSAVIPAVRASRVPSATALRA